MDNNERIERLLDEIYGSWTKKEKDEDGNENRRPASIEEIEKSKEIMKKVHQVEFDDEEVQESIDFIEDLIKEGEAEYQKKRTPEEMANLLLDEIYDVWSEKWIEDETEYAKPADMEEVEESREIVEEIAGIDFDDKEAQERMEEYKRVLDVCEAEFREAEQKQNELSANPDNLLAFEILQKIYNSWSSINYEEEEEYRNPKNKREIKKSRKLLKRYHALNITDPDVKDWAKELEAVLDFNEEKIPSYLGRIIVAWIASLSVIFTLVYLSTVNTANIPEFDYNQALFTIGPSGGKLMWAEYNDKQGKFNRSIPLKPGTKIKPISRYLSYHFQVELPNGQRGLVKNADLIAAKFVVAKKNAIIFNEIASGKWEDVAPGTKGEIIDRSKRKNGYVYDYYIKVKLEDGRIKWAREKHFEVPVVDNIPKINREFWYSLTRESAENTIIGRTLPEIEKKYGLALFVDKTREVDRAYFRHLDMVDDEKHYHIVMVDFGKNGKAAAIEYKDPGKTFWMDMIPLVEKAREYEPNKLMNFMLYDKDRFKPKWWRSLRTKSTISALFVVTVDFIVHIILIALFFSLPLIILTPVMQLFSYTRVLSNDLIIIIFMLLMTPLLYLFFVLLVFIENGFILALIGGLLMWGFHFIYYSNKIRYNRCPSCKTMYSALDEGTTYTGRTQQVNWGTYDKYKNTTETRDKITHHYERRSTKTTTTYDHYLDHRMCFRCGYEWDVEREESSSSTQYM